MLKIIIVQKRILSSFILRSNDSGVIVEDLPAKLRNRVTDALKILCDNGVHALEYDNNEGLVLLQDGKYYAFELIPKCLQDFAKSLTDTMYLLNWFVCPHIYPPVQWRADGMLVCKDCGSAQKLYNSNKCQSPECPSHSKWAEVDAAYVPPKASVASSSADGELRECAIKALSE